jgi:hypothetical protein
MRTRLRDGLPQYYAQIYNKLTLPEDKAPQECDLSAGRAPNDWAEGIPLCPSFCPVGGPKAINSQPRNLISLSGGKKRSPDLLFNNSKYFVSKSF